MLNGYTVRYKPTDENLSEAERMYKTAGVEKRTAPAGTACPYCQEEIKLASTPSLPGCANKRSIALKVTGPVAAVSAAAVALRAAFPNKKSEKITVNLHSGKVDLPGAATIHIY